jgi:hypothetical protein
LFYQLPIAMLQKNFTFNQSSVKITQPLVTVKNNSLSTGNDGKEKACKHRNENGYCSKSQRQCMLVTDLFLKH